MRRKMASDEDSFSQSYEQQFERQSAAIRAIRDVEIEHLRTGLRLLRSYFNEEQLQTPALQFFKENLPNLATIKNGDDGEFEVEWNDKYDNLFMNQVADGRDIHSSLLQRLSFAYPRCSALPSLGGFDSSSDAMQRSLFGGDNLQTKDVVLEGPSDSQMLRMQDGLQTPGGLIMYEYEEMSHEMVQISNQALSIGMTPKTLRLPKTGEMLLSVRGSPLGIYKDDNMEAIRESEED